jgi:nucleoside-diphosphate-sugar epimerase
MSAEAAPDAKPLVLMTGAAGNLGASIAAALQDEYTIIGLDRSAASEPFPIIEADLTSGEAIAAALAQVREEYGGRIASVIHLAAFFDFSGEEHPLYSKLNVEGTRLLLRGLREFEVEQFLYSSTMLVHRPGKPGEAIDEDQPIDPQWAYPRSKAEAEAAIEEEAGDMPVAILRLAGVYDEETMVPTLAQQIARVYERDFESYFYSGRRDAGQAMLHRDDMLDAIRRTVDRRRDLPQRTALLIGEPEAIGYDPLQDEIGYLIHGRKDWPVLRIPKPVAAAGAWAQDKLEPVIPDMIDKGEEPFIKPFMVRMADDHYALDISRAQELLGWAPRHQLKQDLPQMIANLKRDPLGWYKANKVTPPDWLAEAGELGFDPGDLHDRHEELIRSEHARFRWTHFLNLALGAWLLIQPPMIDVEQQGLAVIESVLGAALIVFAALSLSVRMQWARGVCALIGMLVMAAPFVFWTPNAAAYLSDTLVGMLVFGLAVGGRPEIGVSPVAALAGPDIPPGWEYNPSTWRQRLPIIALALLGLYVSRWLAAYQMEQIPGVWEPFFAGSAADLQNGTEEIITSSVSEAFPVPDAALGGFVYALEIVTGIIGSRVRWRTMPWLVILFGILIAPLGIVSISFIIIQPIVIGTWSTLTLVAAAAMLIQIPYSLDELLASLQFLRRRAKAGRNWVTVLFKGDTDEPASGSTEGQEPKNEFDAPAGEVLGDMLSGGVNLPWNLVLCAAIGVWLMFTRLTLGTDGTMAYADHLVGALVLTVISVAAAEVARLARWALVPLGGALFVTPFVFEADTVQTVASLICGAALIALSFPRGSIRHSYGSWDRYVR